MRVTIERFILLTCLVFVSLFVYWNEIQDQINFASFSMLTVKDSHGQQTNISHQKSSANIPASTHLTMTNQNDISDVSTSHLRNKTTNTSTINLANTIVYSQNANLASKTLGHVAVMSNTSTEMGSRVINANNSIKPGRETVKNNTRSVSPKASNSDSEKLMVQKVLDSAVLAVSNTTYNRTVGNSNQTIALLHLANDSLAVDKKKAGKDSHKENITLYVTASDLTEGRLGNQMFRYASLLGIARKQGRKFIVRSGSDLENTFKLQHVSNDPWGDEWPTIGEENAYKFDTKLLNLSLENVRIYGYLQVYLYFEEFADEVKQEFIFRDSIANEANFIVHDLISQRKGSLFVGVHIRRGDFLHDYNKNLGYGIPEKSYYLKAFNWMSSKFPERNITYLVASDDLNWCKENLGTSHVICLPDAAPAVHMAILSSCDHVIMSSGTYSWWSAWLAGGYVIYFNGFMSKGTVFGDMFTAQQYYPPLWIGLGN